MLRVGLIGIGFMGRGHLDNYLRIAKEGKPIQLVAICDIDEAKFGDMRIEGNLDVGGGKYDFSQYTLYTDYREMLKNEKLDYIDIATPTYTHSEIAVAALNAGFNVLCEKPMALNVQECDAMIAASENSGKKLMIAQCLRFWPAYEELKRAVDSGEYGKVTCAYFFRGGGTPIWSYENWLLKKDKSGGALLDQHIHDVDTINWLFGLPDHVATSAINVIEGSGYDAVSTNYHYADGKVVNAQDDWTLNGGYGFNMIFRVNFERASFVLDSEGLHIYPHADKQGRLAELIPDDGYYREILYFANAIEKGLPIETSPMQSTRDTIRIAQAEVKSASSQGAATTV